MSAIAATKSASTSLHSLRELVQNDLARVNHLIADHGQSHLPLINDLAAHVIAAGGKRLRPSITLAAAKLCGYSGERHISLAAAVEFIHTATLLHDDVVDESDMRRGAATANSVWGNQSSVLVGDFLLSRAFQLMVADGSLEVLKILSDAAAIISAGEVHQLMMRNDLSITQTVYEQIISAKTATLFAAAGELGAVVSNNPQWRAPLHQYGHALGMAFQIIDDALDYQSDTQTLGKTIGDDLKDGKITLPVIFAYGDATPSERAFWEETFASNTFPGEGQLRHAQTLLLEHAAFAKAKKVAESYADQALEALQAFPDSLAKQAMQSAAHFAVGRDY